jgi:ribosome-associated toxin RatA of RatAB toxin-antitoxin module
MPLVRKSVIVPHACATMFDLVDRVEDYPQFLPWCSRVELIERTDQVTAARLHVDYHGLAAKIATRNLKDPAASMRLELVEGPFESFAGTWRFVALGESGCRVEFVLDYTLASGALDVLLEPVFGQIAATLVDSFVARAESVRGA